MLSTENIGSDIFHCCFVVTCTLFAFIGLVWLREQILHGGGPDWLEREDGGWAIGGAQQQQIQPPPQANNNLVEQPANDVSVTIMHIYICVCVNTYYIIIIIRIICINTCVCVKQDWVFKNIIYFTYFLLRRFIFNAAGGRSR